MPHLRFSPFPVFCALGFALGCTQSVESTDIRTTGIYPEITVTATGSGTSKVEVQLKVGGSSSNTYLDLTGEDQLKATVGGTAKILDDTGSHSYSASFPVDDEGTEFVISFLRGKIDDSAPASTVSLPAPFNFNVMPTEASRASDAVELIWDPREAGTGNMDWNIDGDCIQIDSGSTPDDGTQSLAAGSIDTFESDKAKSCTVNVGLTRKQPGEIDPAFSEGGSIVARQVRSASFTSNP
jgi:hypothetical protein